MEIYCHSYFQTDLFGVIVEPLQSPLTNVQNGVIRSEAVSLFKLVTYYFLKLIYCEAFFEFCCLVVFAFFRKKLIRVNEISILNEKKINKSNNLYP